MGEDESTVRCKRTGIKHFTATFGDVDVKFRLVEARIGKTNQITKFGDTNTSYTFKPVDPNTVSATTGRKKQSKGLKVDGPTLTAIKAKTGWPPKIGTAFRRAIVGCLFGDIFKKLKKKDDNQ